MTITRKGGALTDDSAAALQAQAVFLIDPSTLAAAASGEQISTSFNITTIKTSITRPADATAYTANDALGTSPAGGFTLTAAARTSGGTGTLTGAIITTSAGTAIQGEVWVFDQAVTASIDNAAFSISDADALNLVGVIPFNTTDVTALNAISYVDGLQTDYTCVGTADLRFLVKVMAGTGNPGSSEVVGLTVKVRN